MYIPWWSWLDQYWCKKNSCWQERDVSSVKNVLSHQGPTSPQQNTRFSQVFCLTYWFYIRPKRNHFKFRLAERRHCVWDTSAPRLAKLTAAILYSVYKSTRTSPSNHRPTVNHVLSPLLSFCSYFTSLRGTCVWRWLKMANTKTCTSRRERWALILFQWFY